MTVVGWFQSREEHHQLPFEAREAISEMQMHTSFCLPQQPVSVTLEDSALTSINSLEVSPNFAHRHDSSHHHTALFLFILLLFSSSRCCDFLSSSPPHPPPSSSPSALRSGKLKKTMAVGNRCQIKNPNLLLLEFKPLPNKSPCSQACRQ